MVKVTTSILGASSRRGTVALSDPASLLPQILRSGMPEPPATCLLGHLDKLGVAYQGYVGGQQEDFLRRGGQKP